MTITASTTVHRSANHIPWAPATAPPPNPRIDRLDSPTHPPTGTPTALHPTSHPTPQSTQQRSQQPLRHNDLSNTTLITTHHSTHPAKAPPPWHGDRAARHRTPHTPLDSAAPSLRLDRLSRGRGGQVGAHAGGGVSVVERPLHALLLLRLHLLEALGVLLGVSGRQLGVAAGRLGDEGLLGRRERAEQLGRGTSPNLKGEGGGGREGGNGG